MLKFHKQNISEVLLKMLKVLPVAPNDQYNSLKLKLAKWCPTKYTKICSLKVFQIDVQCHEGYWYSKVCLLSPCIYEVIWLLYQLMTLFLVVADVYHKEQLVTKMEAEKSATHVWNWDWWWVYVAITKNGHTATRIADILDECGFDYVAQCLRGKCMYVRILVCIMKTVQDPFETAQSS